MLFQMYYPLGLENQSYDLLHGMVLFSLHEIKMDHSYIFLMEYCSVYY